MQSFAQIEEKFYIWAEQYYMERRDDQTTRGAQRVNIGAQ